MIVLAGCGSSKAPQSAAYQQGAADAAKAGNWSEANCLQLATTRYTISEQPAQAARDGADWNAGCTDWVKAHGH